MSITDQHLDHLDLVDELVRVEHIRRTELVHLAVGDRAGLVLTRAQAVDLARDLHRAAADAWHRGHSGASAPGARVRRSRRTL